MLDINIKRYPLYDSEPNSSVYVNEDNDDNWFEIVSINNIEDMVAILYFKDSQQNALTIYKKTDVNSELISSEIKKYIE